MKNFIIFGPPGAGKGSQAVILSKRYNLKHISTGDILREEIRNRTKLGMRVKNLINQGLLVSDDVIIEIIEDVIDHSKEFSGFLYDGFPRTINQFNALNSMLIKHGYKVDAVISLIVEEEIIIKRMLKRAELEGRSDDANIDIVKKRIETYRTQTEPLIEIFLKEGIDYYPVAGNTTIEDTFKHICKILDNLS